MIARSITIVAPIVNEWPAPLPILVILGFSVIGILTSLTFPQEHEFSPGEVIQDTKYNIAATGDGEVASDITYVDLGASNENKNNLFKDEATDNDS